ncbi:Gfo/Idh/MocA family protein [Novosphingobium jiangmenense]|uniref:Gfo/Idh/MocA family oxidoreductase n=1 Tax=Novosphingobium jiangmenense TaxID=2791981 RepID=A0ABS0HJA1_9SPHN|nr:Gfo/Idh/MocA family oxidoreductase [Novosphingobium jiangmenense]MBF9152328.1 Gfo/Idh/MocA family oxidoreductase [Novosphingobium jiangmenense]
MEPVRIGVVGAGDISAVYLNAIARSPALDLRAVATRSPLGIAGMATRFGARAATVAELLADDAIELVLNLTPGVAHEEINAAALEAGKHVYSEKPFALSHTGARRLADLAERRGLLIGSAPDTFYGSAHQAARKALDAGAIGRPVFGTSFLGLPGLEHFHPNPEAFYRAGGEPPFDAGPYYTTMWINLLGPVKRVFSMSGAGRTERTIRRGPRQGEAFPVTVDTSFNTVLEFEEASVSFIISLDVVVPTLRPGELYGSDGILAMADPMFFGGEPTVIAPPTPRAALTTIDQGFATPNRHDHTGRIVADYRGAGLVDLALAIRTGSKHRTGAEFIVHSVEVMEAIVKSAASRTVVDLVSTCERPATIDSEADAALIALTASPFDLAESAPAH